MTHPDEALALARAEAALKRSTGVYADDVRGFTIEPTDEVTADKLLEWAVIEPDPDEVYSTRRFGAPITLLKQTLLRALRQYHLQLLAHQTRFNLQLALYVSRIEDRVQELESELRKTKASSGGAGDSGQDSRTREAGRDSPSR